MLSAMPIAHALAVLQSAGLVLSLTAEQGLKVVPASNITPPLRELIKAHRDDLVRCLEQEASNDPPSPICKDPPDWTALDKAYQAHHFTCPTCIAAGKGYGLRCGTGAALWVAYSTEQPAAPTTPKSKRTDA